MPVDQQSAQDCFFDLVDFAKRQWEEQFYNVKGEEHSLVDEATASDVAEFPLARSSKTGTGEGREGYRRHFDPIQRPAKGKGKGYGQQQRPIFQQAIECWKCGQYGHKLWSVAVDGADGNNGIHMDLIQAAREGRPNGRVGIGDRDTLAQDGPLIPGEDLQLQVPQQRLQSQCIRLQQLRPCLIQPPLLATLLRLLLDQPLRQSLHDRYLVHQL